MRITIAAIGRGGRGKDAHAGQMFDDYAGRLSAKLVLRTCEEKRPLPVADRKRREAELLSKLIPEGAFVVALDEKGKTVTSAEFAKLLGGWRGRGVKDLCFLVGGADGLDDSLKSGANLALSLGAMTWPHRLVPVLLAEQLFRAESILAGHPYHRE
ncbi:MAG: 23S rRNA (pseudouridine(1915)-N(3))-methyltransferase RlmH [Alphaproteobacteria bacterium]|nr:23S rRNA (pseudouridine(1915)-N(3))-methyltransferase RlmH [Alphaproteobacteria bacterium]